MNPPSPISSIRDAPTNEAYANPPGCAVSTTEFVNNAALPIPDAADAAHPGVITSTINVASPGHHLWRVTVTTNITHTFSSDLSIYLISPASTIVTLSTNNGGALNDIFAGTVWMDNADTISQPGPVTLATFVDGVAAPALVPEEAMGAFVGENPNGVLQLLIRDHQRQDVGGLVSWSLAIDALISPPAITTDSSDVTVNLAIPDNGSAVMANLSLADTGASLGGLTLTTYITHPANGNLVVQLITPGGITITVAQNRGSTFENIFNGTVWTDKGGQLNPPGPRPAGARRGQPTERPPWRFSVNGMSPGTEVAVLFLLHGAASQSRCLSEDLIGAGTIVPPARGGRDSRPPPIWHPLP